MQQQPVHGKIKLHGRPAGRPYDLTGIGIYDFVRNFRKAVGRGLDPAAAQLAGVVLVFAAQGPVACRGGVYAAREMARPRRRAGFQNGSPDERFRQARAGARVKTTERL